MIVFISALLSIVLAMLTIPYFNALADRQFVIADLWRFEPIAGVLTIALFRWFTCRYLPCSCAFRF